MAARAPRLREYWQNAVNGRLQRGIDFVRAPWDFDGISQLWFNDASDATHAFRDSAVAAPLIEDEARFLGDLKIITARQNVVVPLPDETARARLLKRVSTLIGSSDWADSGEDYTFFFLREGFSPWATSTLRLPHRN